MNDARLDFCPRLAADAGRLAHRSFGRAFPDDAVLGEEDGASAGLARAAPVWVVDPIDGTANYARGIAHYGISIALLHAGTPAPGQALGLAFAAGDAIVLPR